MSSNGSALNGSGAGEGGPPVVRRGCLIGVILLTVMVSGLGYMFISTLSEMMPPEELRPYAELESTLELVHSKAPAPGAGAQLNEDDVRFYLNALDSVNAPWEQLQPAISAEVEKSGEKIDIIRSMEEFKEMVHLPFYSRRALVNYLNREGKSWDEYLWAKTRVVAAAGITQQDAQNALRALYDKYFVLEQQEDVMQTIHEGSDGFYQKVDSLQKAGMDSAETALVMPYREVLFDKGLHSLVGIEMMFPE